MYIKPTLLLALPPDNSKLTLIRMLISYIRPNSTLNHRETRSALFNGSESREKYPTGATQLDLESQNDEKIEGLTSKVRLLKETFTASSSLLHQISLNIGEAAKESIRLSEGMATDFSQTRTLMGGAVSRLKILSNDSELLVVWREMDCCVSFNVITRKSGDKMWNGLPSIINETAEICFENALS
ncbi:3645_t:CDS:2 [Paraglomus occultum]|uniref:3645_t:CDS:1 n=1 Tax=Paraglomus occultum TaxID=144539 RepID=A0A9N9BA63_9GLOM|nr:3645_t:CDS:2 [Paraglomus occultum]